jgi:hypothetical protein
MFNARNTRWKYHRPQYIDRNVVPYHATLFLLLGIHLNLQRITSTYWSYYLLKYAMKYKPHSPIQLNKQNEKIFDLQRASDAQLQFISSLIIAKPITPSEATVTCLQVPIVQKGRAIKYVDSKPPTLRTKIVTNSCVSNFHPIDGYISKPQKFEDTTFIEYFTTYKMDRITRRNTTRLQ